MITEFLSKPFLAQFFVGAILLFFFFVIVIELQTLATRLMKKGGRWLDVVRFVGIPVVFLFRVFDAAFNIIYMPMLFGFDRANKYGEGWLVTDRLRRHLLIGDYTTWRFKVAAFICRRFLNPVDPGHCTKLSTWSNGK